MATLEDRRVLDQHRDDDVALLAEVGHAGRHARAGRGQRRRLRGHRVVDRQRVAGAANAAGHALAHAPETDEADLHVASSAGWLKDVAGDEGVAGRQVSR